MLPLGRRPVLFRFGTFGIVSSPSALAGETLRAPNWSGAVDPNATGAALLGAEAVFTGAVHAKLVLPGDSSSKHFLLLVVRVGLLGSIKSAVSCPASLGGRPRRCFLFRERG